MGLDDTCRVRRSKRRWTCGLREETITFRRRERRSGRTYKGRDAPRGHGRNPQLVVGSTQGNLEILKNRRMIVLRSLYTERGHSSLEEVSFSVLIQEPFYGIVEISENVENPNLSTITSLWQHPRTTLPHTIWLDLRSLGPISVLRPAQVTTKTDGY